MHFERPREQPVKSTLWLSGFNTNISMQVDISLAYLMDLFVESHQQQVSVWQWTAERAMIFESVEICAVDDAASAVLCNYNPYFMAVVCAFE